LKGEAKIPLGPRRKKINEYAANKETRKRELVSRGIGRLRKKRRKKGATLRVEPKTSPWGEGAKKLRGLPGKSGFIYHTVSVRAGLIKGTRQRG